MADSGGLRRAIPSSPQARLAARGGLTVTASAVALLLPLLVSTYAMSVAVTVVTYAILGLGLNVVVGYAGLLDLGYAAFFAIGAYTSSMLQVYVHMSFWETLPAAVVAAAVSGCIIGYPTLRLRSDYLAIVTLGFGEIVRITVTNLSVTGGPNGLYGIPPASVFGTAIVSENGLYYLGLFFLLIAVVFTGLLSRSRLGRAWRTLREDETASEAVGVPATKVKLLAYVMGAMVGALAGMFFSAQFGTIDPTTFTFVTSVTILMVVIVGGMGSIPGMILGALIVVGLPEALRPISNYRLLIFALGLIVLMLVRPQGLWPARRSRRGSFTAPPAAREAPESPAAGRPQPGSLLLAVSGLQHSFGGVKAVDDVSFDLHAGEILSIIGPNGAGKTTVFNCITGMVTPQRGTVSMRGKQSLVKMKPHKVVSLGLARTFQGVRLFEGLDVAENCLVGLAAHQGRLLSRHGLLGRTSAQDRREALRWLAFVGLADQAHMLAAELSYGDRRRLEIARSLTSRPLALLLDEPAAGTNPTEKRKLMDLVRQVRDSGVTVLLIEHDMGVVMGLSDRVIVLDQGAVIAEGPPEHVRSDPHVIDAYLGRDEREATETVGEVPRRNS
ncbi:MAG: ATP-binding cassette domain-containing protein [Streptosporangiaceae bacterium]|nr:ATP-binding cassette domain-containing protein [Streptosporangiaceae bacterium]